MHPDMQTISISNLSKTYRSGFLKKSNIRALSNVSLEVGRGEIFGLLGPNGAGKTTLIKILLSIVRQSSGSAMILDQPISSTKVRERVGYLPENHRYPQFLTAYQTLVHFGHLYGVDSRTIARKAQALLEMVGLTKWSSVKIKKFSKGMLQRLGLAQALVNDPEVLFLDEPTDGVDPVGRKDIREILKSVRSSGKTVFLNSHLLSEVEEISDRVAILNKGEVVSTGTISQLTSHALEYEIRLSAPAPEPVLSALRSFTHSLSTNDVVLTLRVNAKEDLNGVLQSLLNSHQVIESVTPRRSRLEDFFIDLIQREEKS